ncbi:MAG: carboxypeptidase-like regulatory domain-containing protein [Candidatus Latescibacterota bacterium]
MTRSALLVLVCSTLVNVSAIPARGATISGTVTDTRGQAVVGAQVTFAEESDPSRRFSSLTDADGRYVVGLTEVAVEEETEESAVPGDFALCQNFPNPFNPSTVIPFQMREAGPVRLVIYNTLGQHICTLVDGVQMAGSHRAMWDGHDDAGVGVGAGVYVVRMEAGPLVQSIKMLLVDGSAGMARSPGKLLGTLGGSSAQEDAFYTMRITGADIASCTRTGVAINDDKVLDCVVGIGLSSPENVFLNLDYAMNFRDIGILGDLLDENYRFRFPESSLYIDWGKTEDVTLTGRAFEYFDQIQYELLDTGGHWIEYDVNNAPDGATEISDEHPDENWEVFRRPVTMYLLDETGTSGYFVQTDFEFKMRPQNDPSTGSSIWKIVRWTEYGGFGKLAKTAEASSWGSIKSTFK